MIPEPELALLTPFLQMGETEAWRQAVTHAQVPELAKPGSEGTQASSQGSSHRVLLPPWNKQPRESDGDVGEDSKPQASQQNSLLAGL